jgi:hypothetical protein
MKGILITSNTKPLSHVQFIDNTLLVGHTSIREAQNILKILKSFEEALGQEINKEKSKVLFIKVSPKLQTIIVEILGFQRVELPTKYLGFPLTDLRHKEKDWTPTIYKLRKNLNSWTTQIAIFGEQNCPHC